MGKYITDTIEISSDDSDEEKCSEEHSDDSDEESSNKENSYEENSGEKD